MKVKRKDWEALQDRVEQLEFQVKLAHMNSVMKVPTGEILTSVVVPMILQHLRMEVQHGRGELLPAGIGLQ